MLAQKTVATPRRPSALRRMRQRTARWKNEKQASATPAAMNRKSAWAMMFQTRPQSTPRRAPYNSTPETRMETVQYSTRRMAARLTGAIPFPPPGGLGSSSTGRLSSSQFSFGGSRGRCQALDSFPSPSRGSSMARRAGCATEQWIPPRSVGQVVNLRRDGIPPGRHWQSLARGRLTIGRRLTTCPTRPRPGMPGWKLFRKRTA